jgi:ADP-heptose:LPS heptosyltransferase
LCDAYADFFSEVIARTIPGLHAPHLLARYRRIRAPRRFSGNPSKIRNVFVLSRVTLGADIAVTSVVLDAALRKFPEARIFFVGLRKGWELFAGSPRIENLPIAYTRTGSLTDRFSVFSALRDALCQPASVILDPDSRLTQLGLLPVCPEEDYYFFESRAYGGDGAEPLSALASRWVSETLGIGDARAFLNPQAIPGAASEVTVSLGVGENPAKRVGGDFEERLLRHLAMRGTVLIDKGGGGEEAGRVERAVRASGGGKVRMWEGSFAGFASQIARSKLYVGYDSAGGHAAAASGVPLVSIFGGFASERMYERWRPSGPGPIEVLRIDDPDPEAVWERTRDIINERTMTDGAMGVLVPIDRVSRPPDQ